MTDDEKISEYRSVLYACRVAATVLSVHDIDAMLMAIVEADTLAPLLNPTLYREKAKAMHEDRELLEAARPLWCLAKRHMKVKP